MMKALKNEPLIKQTVNLTSAFVASNSVDVTEISGLLQTTFDTLLRLKEGNPAPSPAAALIPAVAIKESVSNDFIICLEDGKKFKSLKRHLGTHHKMTPKAYRAKWGLPSDYPMTAAHYSKARAELARGAAPGKKATSATKKGLDPKR